MKTMFYRDSNCDQETRRGSQLWGVLSQLRFNCDYCDRWVFRWSQFVTYCFKNYSPFSVTGVTTVTGVYSKRTIISLANPWVLPGH